MKPKEGISQPLWLEGKNFPYPLLIG